jgi:(5-formylfuran-3-yl)methyl phosphate synthase
VSLLSPRFFRRSSPARPAIATQTQASDSRAPLLLVSVRNTLEARAAVAGGCDLLDVKEPDRGPLGMADANVIEAVAGFGLDCRAATAPVGCSAALGELVDWDSTRSEFLLAPGVAYVKFGSARLESPRCWVEAWQRAQSRLAAPAGKPLHRVAVAYADWRNAKCLAPSQLLEAARTVPCDVVLIDTFDKSSGNLLQMMEPAELRTFAELTHRAGMKVALAGSLQRAQIRQLVDVSLDILGVRGAACAGGRRTAPVSATAVRALKREMLATFTSKGEPTGV